MSRSILVIAGLLLFYSATFGQQKTPTSRDTVYVYETVIVYDTLVVYDTLRVVKGSGETLLRLPNKQVVTFFDVQAATNSKSGIILHENINNLNAEDMKVKKVSYIGAIMMLIQSMTGVLAQEQKAEPEKSFPGQVSLVYPLGTMGAESGDYSYGLSCNILAGKTGAIRGVEFGGLFNKVEASMYGAQFGGLGNKTGNVAGAQFGGLGNLTGNVEGVQFGGLGNISGNVEGIQFGGLFNIANNVKGIQFGGLANVTDTTKGIQFGGLANISEEVAGVQFAGLYNQTGTLKGVQFSLVSVTDTVESGASFALVNIVKRGAYKEWALSFSDYANVEFSFKLGIKRLYTIYSVGASFMEDKLWLAGIGFGNRTTLGAKIDIQPEIVCYSYFPNNFKNVQATFSTHIKLGLVYNISSRLGLTFAPSVYFRSNEMNSSGEYYKISPIKPIQTYDNVADGYINELGVGFSVGLNFR